MMQGKASKGWKLCEGDTMNVKVKATVYSTMARNKSLLTKPEYGFFPTFLHLWLNGCSSNLNVSMLNY